MLIALPRKIAVEECTNSEKMFGSALSILEALYEFSLLFFTAVFFMKLVYLACLENDQLPFRVRSYTDSPIPEIHLWGVSLC